MEGSELIGDSSLFIYKYSHNDGVLKSLTHFIKFPENAQGLKALIPLMRCTEGASGSLLRCLTLFDA